MLTSTKAFRPESGKMISFKNSSHTWKRRLRKPHSCKNKNELKKHRLLRFGEKTTEINFSRSCRFEFLKKILSLPLGFMEGKQPKPWKVRNLSLPPAVRQSVRPTVCFATAASRKKGSYFSSLLCYKSETPSETSEKLSSVYNTSFAIALLIVPSFVSSLARTIFPRPSMLAVVGQRDEQRREHSRVSWWRGELGFRAPFTLGDCFPTRFTVLIGSFRPILYTKVVPSFSFSAGPPFSLLRFPYGCTFFYFYHSRPSSFFCVPGKKWEG